MKTGICVQSILRFSLKNFSGCNIGINDGQSGVDVGSGEILYIHTYIPSFIEIALAIQKLTGGGGLHTRHKQQGDLITLLSFFSKMWKDG
jgi:hypothetical protein